MIKTVIAALLSMAMLTHTYAQQYTQLPVSPTRIAMFKNGLGLVTCSFELEEAKGNFQTSQLPDAVFGSFWLYWPDDLMISDIKATSIKVMEEISATNIYEFLRANVGKSVDLKYDNEWHSVKLIEIPIREEQPYSEYHIPRHGLHHMPTPIPTSGELILLKESEQIIAIAPHRIEQVRVESDLGRFKYPRPAMQNVLQFEVSPIQNVKSPLIELAFLASGITWAPSYVVDITDDKHAVIMAKAVVINDLVDLEDCQIELITGYPNLQFGAITSPMSMLTLKDILNQLRHAGSRGDASVLINAPAVMQQRAMISHETMDSTTMFQPGEAIPGEGAEDLYFYQLPPITLKHGDRGYYPLFTERVPYEHIYLWDIPDTIDHDRYYYDQQQIEKPQVVWHALKLTNTSSRPWTTAPAMTRKGGRILGQDTLYYSPPDAPTELKITQAPSIHAEHNEYEIEREHNAARFYNSSHDLVTIKGQLTITNYHSDQVNMKITKTLEGEIISTEANPETAKLAKGLKRVNPRTRLIWNIEIEPGKDHKREITYTYQTYVRN